MNTCRATWPGGACDREAVCKGLCNAHYQQSLRRPDFHPAKSKTHWDACTFPNCGRPNACGGLCQAHYRQQRRGGPLRPIGTHGGYRSGEKRQARPKRTMPEGWERTTKPKREKQQSDAQRVPGISLTPTPAIVMATARINLDSFGAGDLAEALGLTNAELREARLREMATAAA